jgi:ribosomal protein S18 acetylase RimI-like enzyme
MKDSAAHSPGLRFRVATDGDIEVLVGVINVAFRVELPFFDGERVNPEKVREFMRTGKFLLAQDAGELVGCVYVEVRRDRGYVGLLSVIPQRQGSGLGRKLMDAAENYFREAGCGGVDLRVISQRTPLPAFYRHLGYVETGTAPFAPSVPVRVPGHYILMSKSLD